MALAAVRDLRESRVPATAEELADFETDVFAGFVLARASSGLSDLTIQRDGSNLEQIRRWFGRPLWELEPADVDRYLGAVHRGAAPSTRSGKAQTLSIFFEYLELRHKVELYNLTGRAIESPLDEMNRPRGGHQGRIRIPPTAEEVERLFAGWREDLVSCRKFATSARNYTALRLITDVGLRINETRHLDIHDVKWKLGRFGKLHVRKGKGAHGSGPKERVVPLINDADTSLRWYVEDVWGAFGDDHTRHGAPLFPSERKNAAGGNRRISDDRLRASLEEVVERHLPAWAGRLSPHVLRHFCASQLYTTGMDLMAVQELLGHQWVVTTMRYIHPHRTHVEDAWVAADKRAQRRLEGLFR
ncbi:hypothetical protein GCM10023194_44790 [Planotetraspora phitsanulokensis]|uniref:Site-specific recombinase XerD n=1 Tax=Planotetraspora phitsanulokensis TaxID=575192 RepID=A0A8J3U4I7_9ACTN|nr:tyrosine-type recombinase/integrase [Planotetraspora phitsanulokensis]GII38080.1 hypothetical protein Pph01_30830 [Planotetraspora phitsanulokensis]